MKEERIENFIIFIHLFFRLALVIRDACWSQNEKKKRPEHDEIKDNYERKKEPCLTVWKIIILLIKLIKLI